MAELMACWDPRAGSREVREVVERGVRALPWLEDLKRQSFATDGFAAVRLSAGQLGFDPQPIRSDVKDSVLFLEGEIANLDELPQRAAPRPSGVGAAPSSGGAGLLGLLDAGGPACLRHLSGQFALLYFRPRERRLLLANDRFGFRPVFVLKRGGRLLVASRMRMLAAADDGPQRVDAQGLFQLFAFGTPVFEETWLEGVRRLPPASALQADEGGTRTERYWVYRYDESAPTLDQHTYATVYAKLVDRAVERRMRLGGRVGVFLSGGYDSRAVAGAIRAHHKPLPAFTFGMPDSRDVRYAAELSRRLGFTHTVLTPGRPYLTRCCRSIVERTEGLLPFTNTTSLLFHHRIRKQADIVLTGFLAEYNGSHYWPALYTALTRKRAAEVIFRRMTGAHLGAARRVFDGGFYRSSLEALRQRFQESLDAVDNDHPFNLSDAWDYRYRHPWSYQASAVDRPVLDTRAPLLDVELLEFLLRIPWHARIEQRIYKRMIAWSYPEIRDVPCTNSGRPIDPCFPREYLKMAARMVGRRVRDRLPVFRRRRRGLGREFVDLAEDMRREPEFVSEILEPLCRSGPLAEAPFDPEGIRRLIAEHYEQGADHSYTLALLASWGLAAEMLLRGTPPGHGRRDAEPRGAGMPGRAGPS